MFRSTRGVCLAVLLAALALPAPLTGQSTGKGRSYAFLVACSGYDVTELRKLPFTVREMAEFRDALLATGFDAGDIKFLHDGAAERRLWPEKARIEKELALLLARVEPGDTILVALNGHGLQFKGDKSGYFCPLDAVVAKRETLLPMDDVFAQLKTCPAKRKLLIVNACRNDPLSAQSQASNKVELVDRYEEVPEGIAALYACGPGQKSYFYDPEDKRSEGRKRSLFMHHLIEAWHGKYADGGPVSLEGIFAAVKSKTVRDADNLFGQMQVPQVKREYQGEWVITKAAKLSTAKPPVSPAVAPQKPRPDEGLVAEMKFMPIPKGTFWMGWDSEQKQSKQVVLDRDFQLAAYCVTQGQWEAVRGNNPSYFSRQGKGKDKVKGIPEEELARFPVENVSWNDVQKFFIYEVNEREKGKGWLYRLPTEAEWEYACRNAAKTKEDCSFDFYLFDKGTNDLTSYHANFNGERPAGNGKKGSFLNRTEKVGQYPPNKLGLYDMHGNVWQWCDDPSRDDFGDRVFCGGFWYGDGAKCRAASRDRRPPSFRGYSVGFRLARVLTGKE